MKAYRYAIYYDLRFWPDSSVPPSIREDGKLTHAALFYSESAARKYWLWFWRVGGKVAPAADIVKLELVEIGTTSTEAG